jgi:hypothetical protein
MDAKHGTNRGCPVSRSPRLNVTAACRSKSSKCFPKFKARRHQSAPSSWGLPEGLHHPIHRTGKCFRRNAVLGFFLVNGMAQHYAPLSTAIVTVIVAVAIAANTLMLRVGRRFARPDA